MTILLCTMDVNTIVHFKEGHVMKCLEKCSLNLLCNETSMDSRNIFDIS